MCLKFKPYGIFFNPLYTYIFVMWVMKGKKLESKLLPEFHCTTNSVSPLFGQQILTEYNTRKCFKALVSFLMCVYQS